MLSVERARYQNALRKAAALGGSARVTWMHGGKRSVKGTHRRYIVTVRDWSCACEAGQRGLPCYHAAAAYMADLRDQSGGMKAGRN